MKVEAKAKASVVLLALALAACDGGSSGTGITTAQGNVASADTALRGTPRPGRPTMLARLRDALQWPREARARGPLEDIRVTIEGTRHSVTTDPQGHFGLSGHFAGPVGMVFELPDGGSARLVITVPRGGALTLSNVHIDGRTGAATVDDQRVRFDGLVSSTDCGQHKATVVSRRSPEDGNHYTVHFAAATVHDRSGAAVGCADLAPGEPVDVDGHVRREGEVEAESVQVEHDPSDSVSAPPSGQGGVSNPGNGDEPSAERPGGGGGGDDDDEEPSGDEPDDDEEGDDQEGD